jgi:hypothetical protein
MMYFGDLAQTDAQARRMAENRTGELIDDSVRFKSRLC